MLNKITWTFQFNNDEIIDRKTFFNGYVIKLLDDGTLFCPDRNVYSDISFQSMQDISPDELMSFIDNTVNIVKQRGIKK